MTQPKTHLRCTKAGEIEAIKRDLRTLNKVVMEGNGTKSLVVLTTETRDYQKSQSADMKLLNTNVSALMTFQTIVETEKQTKRDLLERKLVKRRWVIPMLVSAILGLSAVLVASLTILNK